MLRQDTHSADQPAIDIDRLHFEELAQHPLSEVRFDLPQNYELARPQAAVRCTTASRELVNNHFLAEK